MDNQPKQPDILDVTQKSEIFQRQITAREIIRRVIDFLILRATQTGAEQNEDRKLGFPEVSFWFKNTRDQNKNVLKSELMFTTPPESWNFERILVYIEDQERSHMINVGVDISGIDYISSNMNSSIFR